MELERLKRQLIRRERKISELVKDRQAMGAEAEAASRAAAEAARVAKEVTEAAAAALASAQASMAAGPSNILHAVPPPPHWQPCRMGQELETVFVSLPWPPGVLFINLWG